MRKGRFIWLVALCWLVGWIGSSAGVYAEELQVPALPAEESTEASEEAEVSPDQPGFGTSVHVLDKGFIQWETGFQVDHALGAHILTLPTTLFRFGVCSWAELRVGYEGSLVLDDHPVQDSIPDALYAPEHPTIGTKIRLWGGSEDPKLKWIPKTSLMLTLGLPINKYMVEYHPVIGQIDFLFENELTDWMTMGYDLGIYWLDYAPTPDIFASLGFEFTPTDKLSVYIENYNLFDPDAFDIETPAKKYTVSSVNLNFGLSYLVHPRVQLDIYAGFNLYHTFKYISTPINQSLLGLGVTWLIYYPKR